MRAASSSSRVVAYWNAAVPSRSMSLADVRYSERSIGKRVCSQIKRRQRRLYVALPPCMSSENLRCVQRGARLVDQGGKRRGIVHGEIGENLPIHLDAG